MQVHCTVYLPTLKSFRISTPPVRVGVLSSSVILLGLSPQVLFSLKLSVVWELRILFNGIFSTCIKGQSLHLSRLKSQVAYDNAAGENVLALHPCHSPSQCGHTVVLNPFSFSLDG